MKNYNYFVIFMCSLFETHKELLVFFKSLQGITLSSELRSNKTLVGHVKGVMLTIDEAITNLDHADNTIEMLTHVGKTHTRFDGFNPEVFKVRNSFCTTCVMGAPSNFVSLYNIKNT